MSLQSNHIDGMFRQIIISYALEKHLYQLYSQVQTVTTPR